MGQPSLVNSKVACTMDKLYVIALRYPCDEMIEDYKRTLSWLVTTIES